LIEIKDWYNARKLSAELIATGLDGLHYLQTYERLLIRAIVTAAYIGWAAYASLFLFRPLDYITGPLKLSQSSYIVSSATYTTLIAFWILFAIQRSPWTFYVYIAFPCYFWRQFLLQVIPALQNRLPNQPINYLEVATRGCVTFAILQGMVVCTYMFLCVRCFTRLQAAYTHRRIWSIGFLLIGVAWPFTWPKEKRRSHLSLLVTWSTLCIIASIFPLLSVEKQESLPSM
jgi:phosphatidylinositol glycan class N